MVAPNLPCREYGNPEVRVRRSLFGKLIVQVRYPVKQAQWPYSKEPPKHVGVSRWRDASADNFEELQSIRDRLSKSNATENGT